MKPVSTSLISCLFAALLAVFILLAETVIPVSVLAQIEMLVADGTVACSDPAPLLSSRYRLN